MKAGSKRCSMCGQPRPPGRAADNEARQPRGVANKNAENSNSNGGRADSGVHGSASDGSKGAAVGRGIAPKSLSTLARVLSSSAGGSDGVGVRSPSPAAPEETKGTWMCVGCGNEYGASRLKCRACKTPRPVTVAKDKPAAAAGAGGIDRDAARDKVSERQVGNVDSGHRGPGKGGGSEEDEDEESLIGHRRESKLKKSASRDGSKTNGDREVTFEAPAVAPASTTASAEATAPGVRNLCAGVVGGPATAPVASAPRQPRLATPKCEGKRFSSEPLQRSMQHHTPESVQGRRPVVGAAGADESPAPGSGRSTTTEDLTEPCPSPATQESQDNDSFAGLFPSLHQFEAGQEGLDSTGGVRDQGTSSADVDVLNGGSTGGISRFDGGLSPLVTPAPRSMPSSRSKVSTSETSSARPPTTSTIGLAIPPPPVLSAAPVARLPPPATPTKDLVLPPPPVFERESGVRSHAQRGIREFIQTRGGGGEIGNGGGGGRGGGGGSQAGGVENSSQSSGGGSGGGDRGRPTPDQEREDDDVFCGVCGDASPKEDDPILLCDGEGCETAVHADCYGVTEIPEGPWLCEPCSSSSGHSNSQSCGLSSPSRPTATKGTQRCGSTSSAVADARKKAPSAASSTSCALCRRSGGVLKRSRCGRWAHVVCVWWTPELTSDPDTVRPGPLSELDPTRETLTCSLCHERGGAVVQCAAPVCLEACHPFCALRSGFFLRENDGVFELFCRTHSRRERQREDQRQGHHAHAAPRGGDMCRLDESRVTGGQMNNTGGPRPIEGETDSTGGSAACIADSMLGAKNECRNTGETVCADAKDEAGRSRKLIPTQTESSGLFHCSQQSQAESPVVISAAAAAGRRRRLRKHTMNLSDSEGDEDGTEHSKSENDGAVGGTSSPVAAAAKVAAARKGGRKGGAGGDTGDERGTPLKVFDMAPPATSGTKFLRGGGGRGEGGMYGSPVDVEGVGEGCDDGLVTLSQAISPVDDVRKDVKRRRLKKVRGEGYPCVRKQLIVGLSRERSQKKQPSEPKAGERAFMGREKGGGASKGRRCEFDKSSYRRYIDHEAEVDEDISDDDEADLDDFYDSQDSFVDDGPLSYETSSSQEEGDSDSGEEDASIGSRRGKGGGNGNGTKKKKKRRLGDDEDEKGMYLQLMAMSQTPVRPGGASTSSRNRNRGGTRDGRGGRAIRGGGRCAFINAVMSHARDGGDPLDIENACDSDISGASSLTEQQRRKMQENRARALERLRQRQAAKVGGGGGGKVGGGGLSQGSSANLSRYARVVVIVEGLEDDQSHRHSGGSGGRSDRGGGGGGGGDSQGDEAEQAAIDRVEALHGVSVVASRGWKDTADKVVQLVVEEERAGVGLPSEVTGPSLTAAQMKFLSLLLRAPTLSYPGGLFLLQAFRGRSVKEVISSAAKEFQIAVPGMTAQQAAKLKRFLVSAGASPRRNNKNPNPRNGIGSGRRV
ncbi:unnamed protein product [Sphacelaria rigidula]